MTRTERSALLSAMLLAIGCSEADPVLPGDKQVLARVGETVLTQYDLEQSLTRSFSEETRAALDEVARKKVLESMVTSRALALAREKELTPAEHAALERKVASYREEQLVIQYLTAHAAPASPSSESIEKYYREHGAEFGALEHRRYELITSERELSPSERDALLKELTSVPAPTDWAAWVTALRKRGHAVLFSAARDDERVLHMSLRERIAKLLPGQSSELTFLDGRPYLLRVTSVEATPPLPLETVRERIAATLAPLEIKVALQRAERMVLPKVRVEYEN